MKMITNYLVFYTLHSNFACEIGQEAHHFAKTKKNETYEKSDPYGLHGRSKHGGDNHPGTAQTDSDEH